MTNNQFFIHYAINLRKTMQAMTLERLIADGYLPSQSEEVIKDVREASLDNALTERELERHFTNI